MHDVNDAFEEEINLLLYPNGEYSQLYFPGYA